MLNVQIIDLFFSKFIIVYLDYKLINFLGKENNI